MNFRNNHSESPQQSDPSIGSGAIEGGIRFIGKDRLNRSGMRWNIRGAERILQLRCVKYSDRWQELAEKHVAKRAGFYQRVRTAWYKVCLNFTHE